MVNTVIKFKENFMKKLLILPLLLLGCDNHSNYPQPQIVQQNPAYVQPSQPVIIQQESSSGLGSFAAGAAVGALAGHVATNMVNDKKDAPTPSVATVSNASVSNASVSNASVSNAPKVNHMDMSKLSESNHKPISKPISSMNMSKLSKK